MPQIDWPKPPLNPQPPAFDRWLANLEEAFRSARKALLPLSYAQFMAKFGDSPPENPNSVYAAFVQRYNDTTEEILERP